MDRRTVLTALSATACLASAGCVSDLEDVTGSDEETVKEKAETIEYEELYRNISEYEGDAVTYSNVTLTDIATSEDGYYEFILLVNEDGSDDEENASEIDFGAPEYNYIYGIWEGDPFQKDDEVELWGTVNGTTTYMSLGGERTVPEIEIVDMELM